MCEEDRAVKTVRRGGSRKPDGCLITCLAIWTVVTELLNPIHRRKCVWTCLCVSVCVCGREMESNCFSACTHPHFPRSARMCFSSTCRFKSAKMLIRS